MRGPGLVAIALTLASPAVAQIPKLGADTSAKASPAEYEAARREVARGTYLRGLWRSVKVARQGSPVGGAARVEADRLIDEADRLATAGNTGAAYPLLLHGLSLLTETPWSPEREFGVSLGLSTQTLVADQTAPLLISLGQRFPARRAATGPLVMRVSLVEAPWPPLESREGVGHVLPPDVRVVKRFWTDQVASKDLILDPVTAEIDVGEVPEGRYLVRAEMLDGDAPLIELTTPVTVVRALVAREARVEQALARVKGHDSAKATVRYPFNLARAINGWRREVPENVDLPKALTASEALADQLSRGTDPLERATGDHTRHYWLATAGEILPYRLYVPTTWDGRRRLPMVIDLHGGGGNEDQDFVEHPAGTETLAALAERFGVIVVAVSGYRPNGGYGQVYGPPPIGRPGVWPPSPARSVNELSEADALSVMTLVAQEYDVDRTRVYLVGNSLGGGGVWHLASTHPELFAAVAPCASSMDLRTKPDFAFDRMKAVPTMAVVGERDERLRQEIARYGVDQLRQRGGEATFVEVKGGIHTNAWRIALPDTFQFFLQHTNDRAAAS